MNLPRTRKAVARPALVRAWLACLCLCLPHARGASVTAWETNEVLPTYLAAPPDPNPRFYQGRTYQGARATFYPYAVQDRLTEVKALRPYRMVYLENEFVRLGIAPELGGRIFSAIDRSNGYDFFYRQRVIKPALIGMLGAWISGGVEYNVPHHHRATSFMPVAARLVQEPDGGRTVWVGETEWRHRMQWSVGVTLRPGSSVVEMQVRMANATALAHPMLFWINPAVHANDHYQVLFPPGTEFVTQHAKPEFAHWPIARERYGGVDYTRGVDISWWRNHPAPVSFFAWNFTDDWFGGYDHGRDAGVLHVADHRVAPGKKFFEWGVGGEGEAWSRILTDEDGPYLELMAGAWSDNQPDYSWILPGETREWTHHWFPIRQLGGATHATTDGALNLVVTNRTIRVAVNATRVAQSVTVKLTARDQTLFEQRTTISPASPFMRTILVETEPDPEALRLTVADAQGREWIRYQPQPRRNAPMPDPVRPPKPPAEISSTDELYATGQRIEQLLSPSYEAAPYYEDMLRRDPGDSRAHAALGILACANWKWVEAETHLRASLARSAADYIRPKDGEARYYLGVALRGQGRWNEAAEAFGLAAWSQAWKAPANLALAEIECRQGRREEAIRLVDRALDASRRNPSALALKTALLRHAAHPEAAAQLAAEMLAWNPLDARAGWEAYAAARATTSGSSHDTEPHQPFASPGHDPQVALEIVADQVAAGLWDDALQVLAESGALTAPGVGPLAAYWRAWCLEQAGRNHEASQAWVEAARAAQTHPEFCFPFRWEEEAVLRRASAVDPRDPRAPYLLGNLLYDRQPTDAVQAWEKARDLDPGFARVHRNLGLAMAQLGSETSDTVASLERAVELLPDDPRLVYELDVLMEASGQPIERRLQMLEAHQAAAQARDDTTARWVALDLAAGKPDQALLRLHGRRFHNWEGSDAIRDLYVDARLALGRVALRAGKAADARAEFEAASAFPDNLEVGKPHHDPRLAEIDYHLGLAAEAAGDPGSARQYWERCARERARSSAALTCCRARALSRLGRADESKALFESLANEGRQWLNQGPAADYFAKFGQRRSKRVNQALAWYSIALGEQGLGRNDAARSAQSEVLRAHPGFSPLLLSPPDGGLD